MKIDQLVPKINEHQLNERTQDLDDDVDRIYDHYFSKIIEAMNDRDIGYVERRVNNMKNMFVSMSSMIDQGIIQSESIISANENNRVHVVFFRHGNMYRPSEGLISLSINEAVIDILSRYSWKYDSVLDMAKSLLPRRQIKQFMNEMSGNKVKGSIYHELAHYLDDTQNAGHLRKKLDKYRGSKTKGVLGQDKGLRDTESYVELEGQIHNIKQLKRSHFDEWDDLSFDDMLELESTFQFVDGLPPRRREEWQRAIKKRMAREGLLGTKMR